MATPSTESPPPHDHATDYALDRTVLANERTYAAWLRTGLAALVAGIAIEKFMVEVMPTWSIRSIAMILISFSGVAFGLAGWRFTHLGIRLRGGRRPDGADSDHNPLERPPDAVLSAGPGLHLVPVTRHVGPRQAIRVSVSSPLTFVSLTFVSLSRVVVGRSIVRLLRRRRVTLRSGAVATRVRSRFGIARAASRQGETDGAHQQKYDHRDGDAS